MAHRLSYPHHPKSTSTPYLCTKKHQQIGARASCPRTPPNQQILLTKPHHQRVRTLQPKSGESAKRSEGILPSYPSTNKTTQPNPTTNAYGRFNRRAESPPKGARASCPRTPSHQPNLKVLKVSKDLTTNKIIPNPYPASVPRTMTSFLIPNHIPRLPAPTKQKRGTYK